MGLSAGTAGLIAAGVGAVGSVAGSLINSSAAGSAADTQSAAANQASANALAQYRQTREDLSPYRTTGGSALNRLGEIFGLNGPSYVSVPVAQRGMSFQDGQPAPQAPAATGQYGLPEGYQVISGESGGGDIASIIRHYIADKDFNVISELPPGVPPELAAAYFTGKNAGTAPQQQQQQQMMQVPVGSGGNPLAAYGLKGLTFQPTQAELEATPGFQFNLNQGRMAVANSNAAQGRGISGAALKGAANYATGLANNTLTTQQGIFQQNLGNVLNPLMSLSGMGQNAAAVTGSQGLQAVGNANNALVGGANAQAAGMVGGANALSSGLSGVGSSAMNYALYKQLTSNSGGTGYIDQGSF
jgi:hypothetical protein